jgi:hypothetical protein
LVSADLRAVGAIAQRIDRGSALSDLSCQLP